MKTNLKTAGAILGATMMATAGIAGVAPAFADDVSAAEAQAVEAGQKAVKSVEGEFSFAQDKVTGMGVFAKAAAAVCASMPDYGLQVGCTCLKIAIMSGDAELIATVQELMADGETETHIVGCACSSNAAAGGAIGNAEVSGVSLASVAAIAGA